MEVVGELLSFGKRVCAGERVAIGIPRAVQAAVLDSWLLADVLHDVDLAAVGPTDSVDVRTHRPESRPDARPVRELDAGFDLAISGGELTFGLETARGVVTGFVFQSANHQMTLAVLMNIFERVRVRLQFVISPTLAVVTEIIDPFGSIRRGVGGAIEFV